MSEVSATTTEEEHNNNNNNNNNNKVYGVTDPISSAQPTDWEITLTTRLSKVLEANNLFETEEEALKREEVLGKLNVIVKEWSKSVSLAKGLGEQLATDAGAKIFTFGSYRLGVNTPGADIDTLCVGPRHVDRQEFFFSLPEILKKHPEVTDLTLVPDAYVPVIKFTFSGIQIDLLYARLSLSIIPDNMELDDDLLLKNLDDKSVRSLNGCRVTDSILKLVPCGDTFRIALRCIKLWARVRGIYANIVGYLGGVSWAILIARICQLYPNATASAIVTKFFRVFYQWKWPTPVILNQITPETPAMAHRVWNSRQYAKDRTHLMPIITPAYPAMNSTYNVTQSTLNLMKDEFVRGSETTVKIYHQGEPWENLFEPCDFFHRYKVYLQVKCCAYNREDLRKWEGWTESRLRVLIIMLEQTEYVKLAQPLLRKFPFEEEVERPDGTKNIQPYSCYYMGLKFDLNSSNPGTVPLGSARNVDLTPAVVGFVKHVSEWQERIEGMSAHVSYLRRNQLPESVLATAPPRRSKRAIADSKQKQPQNPTKRQRTTPTPTSPSVSKSTTNTVVSTQETQETLQSSTNTSDSATPKTLLPSSTSLPSALPSTSSNSCSLPNPISPGPVDSSFSVPLPSPV